jgi:hypothetical protein
MPEPAKNEEIESDQPEIVVPPSGKVLGQNMRYFFFALLGGTAGFTSSIVFWFVYFFQTFSAPVSQLVRVESALLITIFIIAVVVAVFYFRTIIAIFRRASEHVEVDDPDTDDEGDDGNKE